MSLAEITRLFLPVIICATLPAAAVAQGCKYSGAPEWNESVRSVIADCAAEFLSPDKHLLLKFSADGGISIEGKTVRLKRHRIEPPASVSWSPTSKAFFVNDGEGSGMSSTFRLFTVKGAKVLEDQTAEKAAVFFYRRRTHCSSSAADPSVYSFGWGDEGTKIYLLVQATVDEPCGPPYGFVSLVVQTTNGRILETLSEAQTKERFGSLLPSSLFAQ